MPSAVIRDFSYDESRNELTVSFVSGKVYVYSLVPPSVAAAFTATPAKGAFFNDAIRDRYRHRQVKADASPGDRAALVEALRRSREAG